MLLLVLFWFWFNGGGDKFNNVNDVKRPLHSHGQPINEVGDNVVGVILGNNDGDDVNGDKDGFLFGFNDGISLGIGDGNNDGDNVGINVVEHVELNSHYLPPIRLYPSLITKLPQ